MQKHRVILIRNAQPYDFGGGERFPVFVAEALKQHEFEPIIISRHETLSDFATSRDIRVIRGWWWGQQQWSGARVALLPVYILWQATLYIWYRRQFARLKPSAVHIQSKDDFIAATYAAKHAGAQVVWTDHADLKHVWKNLQVWYKNPIGKLAYRAARHADHITVVSESERREVTAHLPDASPIHNKITVVYNGCQDVLTKYPRQLNDKEFTFIFAGRLVTDKGVNEALTAFSELHAKYPDTRLLIAGDGPERQTFEHFPRLDGVSFLGYQNDPYLTIRRGNVFLQPTYHEGFSVALVEASMLKMPIIATQVGGNVEIIRDHDTGLLIPARNAEALQDAMGLLYADKDLRRSIAAAARKQYLERFVFDTIVARDFIPLYTEVPHGKN